jgi:repressor LexA
MERLMATSDNIRQLRKRAGYTQTELAKLIGVDRSAVAQWENDLSQPRMGNVRKLAEVLRTTTTAILDGEETPAEGRFSRPFVRLRPLGHVHAGSFAEEDSYATTTIELPVSVLERHPNAEAVLVEGDCMDRIVPEGMAVVIDPDLEPSNGKIVVVETEDHEALIRRWYRGTSTLMLVADSHQSYDDIVLDAESSVRLIGTVVWVQSPAELGA